MFVQEIGNKMSIKMPSHTWCHIQLPSHYSRYNYEICPNDSFSNKNKPNTLNQNETDH